MACSSSCPTGDHASWGSCVRSKNLGAAVSVPGNNYDRAAQQSWDKRIDSYREARSEGIQPAGTKAGQIQAAVRESDRTGEAFKPHGV